MWDLPGPGLEPVSPALAGGFLTTAPPGKSLSVIFIAFATSLLVTFIIFFLITRLTRAHWGKTWKVELPGRIS